MAAAARRSSGRSPFKFSNSYLLYNPNGSQETDADIQYRKGNQDDTRNGREKVKAINPQTKRSSEGSAEREILKRFVDSHDARERRLLRFR